MNYEELRIHADKIVEGVVYRTCPQCKRVMPLDEFGIRRMKGRGHNGASDLITNQSWCRTCR